MKTLATHMNEALKIGKNLSQFSAYSCQPKNRDELIEIIRERLYKEGSKCDLNDIDVSLVDDLSGVFSGTVFNGDVSRWNTSNAKYMTWMFYKSYFNGNISRWDLSNVKSAAHMFSGSHFNQDISNWNVSNVNDMSCMFKGSKFNQDISNWKINKYCDTHNMFIDCSIRDEFKPVF